MPIRRPYYGLHQIITGQYTIGNKYVLDDGTDYIGMFHILPNSQLFTNSIPNINSVELFEKRVDIEEIVKRYNRLTDNAQSKYLSPKSFQPMPSLDDYKFGEIQRFFVQRRNNPQVTITEIDSAQYNSINTKNLEGINGTIWNRALIPWKISKIPKEDAAVINRRELIKAEKTFRYIGIFIINVLEFYR